MQRNVFNGIVNFEEAQFNLHYGVIIFYRKERKENSQSAQSDL